MGQPVCTARRRTGGLFVACAAASAVLAAALTGCSGPGQTAGGQTAAGQSAAGQSPPAARSTPPASGAAGTGGSTAGLPRPAHVVVVIEENKSYSDVIGDPSAPYINSLASRGALFTRAAAVAHPSEPNYLAIFSGSTKGVTDDSCPHTFAGDNLASEATAAHLTFAGYSESMPHTGYTGCESANYARKHNPWSDFPNVPARDNRAFASFPPDDAKLPTISFVIPNLMHDMHDGTVAQGDRWLKTNLNGYAKWAVSHNSLLVLTWDEDDGSAANHIATVITGAHVRRGRYGASINHYNVLRTIEDLYRMPHAGASAAAAPLTGIF